MRKVIVHYHIFKNAGTSFDGMLKSGLGDAWVEFEDGGIDGKIPPARVEEFILDHPRLKALSSHQLTTPLIPKSVFLEIIPVVFIRHPIDRAYSAYLFEIKKQKTKYDVAINFNEYIDTLLKNKNKNAIENYQCLHLANDLYDDIKFNIGDVDLLASVAIDRLKQFSTFGLVDKYDFFLKKFKTEYQHIFPELKFQAMSLNTMQNNKNSIDQKIDNIRDVLGDDGFKKLTHSNFADTKLYQFAKANYFGRP